MSDDIVFDRNFPLAPGAVDTVAPGVRRILCPNPSPFTFTGTVTYIVGSGRVAIVDPGPDVDDHVAAILDAVRGETVTHIFVTHTHRDHSPAAAKVKAATGGLLLGEGPHRASRTLHSGETKRLDAGGDQDFRPEQALRYGDVVAGDGWALEALATPGHTGNHMAYALAGTDIMFSGDHVMGWSTTIVAPPDGSMRDYMNSLDKLAARRETVYLPGHGPAIRNASRYVAQLRRHREAREAAILRELRNGPATIPELVQRIYVGLDPKLAGAAGWSVLAHLEDVVARGLVSTEGEPTIAGTYRVVAGAG
ncbi:MAG: MBL fold metallo-hydrolase [Rhizobiales bacterium]|nr:MBL fold metallo-hydrolase [Hyphomicrobiales bacterium]